MADIVFRYPEMRAAASDIRNIAQRYTAAAQKFESDIIASISDWEGESKEKFVTFIQGAVHQYIEETIPNLIKGLAELLEANADQMEKADQQIADNIPQSLG